MISHCEATTELPGTYTREKPITGLRKHVFRTMYGRRTDSVNRWYKDLFVFIRRRDVPSTNNCCERALRPSVIFRKVTGGFRSQWGAQLYAAIVSVVGTAQISGKTSLQAIADVLNPARKVSAPQPI